MGDTAFSTLLFDSVWITLTHLGTRTNRMGENLQPEYLQLLLRLALVAAELLTSYLTHLQFLQVN